ncbi:MAG: hypothetical protein LUE14_11630, partial [Clostridiales bacterium]|nr:hypothetical protein [Clostridiales bacterium]
MKAKKVTKTALGITMAAALVASSFVIPATTEEAQAATDWTFTFPTTAMDVETVDGKTVMTTLTQRAASEIPLIFGVNTIGGNMFNGLQYLAGTDVNENPDPYIWNYNYMQETGDELATGFGGVAYAALGNAVSNPNGLYQSGGGNQSYATAVEELGGVGYAIGWRTDVIFSFNSTLISQIDWVNSLDSTSEYYVEGDEDYSPLLADVQTAGVSARLYAWTDMGSALSAYLDEHEDLTTRYDDPEIIGENVAQFSAGIPYYIASLIADGTIEKKTMAYVGSYSDNTLTLVDPTDVGTVRADCYAEVQNFNYIEGTYTFESLMEECDVDIIVLGASGYSYGAGGNGAAGSTGVASTDKAAVLAELADLGYSADEMPLVMDESSSGVTIGNNGYNYAPTTPMFMPYIQVYAYMDELAEVNEAINPVAMVMFMFDECAHVKDESVEDVAFYYIGTNWDAVDETYDQVPDQENYVYDKDAIIAAIQVGIEYALSGEAEANGNLLTPAYSSNETAYLLLTEYATETKPEDETHEYITMTVNGVEKYLDLTELIALDAETDDSEDSGHGGYASNTTNYTEIIAYYNSGDYGYGANLQETLQNYADHMVEHVWVPDTDVEGTYATYGADYSAVEEAIAAAEALNEDDFMDLSEVEAAIAAVDYTKLISEQDDVDAMAQAIIDAIADLTMNGDTASLETAAEYAALLIDLLDESDYTAESWAALEDAYAAVQDVLSGKATQETIDEALAALTEAANSLEKATAETYTGDTLAIRSGNTFYLYDALGDDTYSTSVDYGRVDDEVLVGDWDGDGVETFCVRRGNTYYFSNDTTFSATTEDVKLDYGRTTDEVIVGDWDNDGKDTLCVRRGNTYYFSNDLTST